jgi:hypothetical protein
MKTSRILVTLCITLGLLQTGCGEDRTIKTVPDKVVDTGKTPVAPPAPPGKQKDLTCPSGWEDFCGGWSVLDSASGGCVGSPTEHMVEDHQFVIGKKGSKVYLFPRDDLESLWNTSKVELTQLTSGGVACLTGKVKLKHAGADAWHRILLTAGTPPTPHPEIGTEVVLNIAFIAEAPSAPMPTSCLVPPESCGAGGDHGGLAHAED